MNKEDKSLLLQDLCARLPYNLYIRVEEFNVAENDGRITEGFIGNYLKDNRCSDYDADEVLNELADDCIDIKPYLRSMLSMTQKEMEEYNGEFEKDRQDILKVGKEFEEVYKNKKYESVWQHLVVPMYRHIIWLLKNHFDFMGLIPKDLAIEVTEENNPYKN